MFPPFPSIIYPAGKVKFFLLLEYHGNVDKRSKKMVKLYTTKAFGILYNSDIFASNEEVLRDKKE